MTIFLDANVPMYLEGPAHPLRTQAEAQLLNLVGHRLVTDAEMLQEIVHRFSSLRRFDVLDGALRTALGLVTTVYDFVRADALRAAEIVQVQPRLSARDAVHIAVMERHGIRRILSFDSGFDLWPGIVRLR